MENIMKYGLIYYKDTKNLGDDILTYAGKRFLPRVDYYIDRENMDLFLPDKEEYVAAILNGWYLHYTFAFPPSPYILPLFVGTHFNKDNMIFKNYCYLDGTVADYLKEKGPIGCRDKNTMEILAEKEIDSYFSGCLTLTLQKYSDVLPNGKIILTDVSASVEQYIKSIIRDKKIDCVTHELSELETGWEDWQKREERVESYLKMYQGASLVVTTRLHCALPCIALGTPVLLIGKYDEDYYDRIHSFSQYCICHSEEDILSGKADGMLTCPKQNKDIKEIVCQIEKTCTEFINMTENMGENYGAGLPQLEMYKGLYIERASRMRQAIYMLLHMNSQLAVQHVEDVDVMKRMMQMIEKLAGRGGE